ncbi:PKD2L1 [Branchiostoma lanceolatum]|uniref:PKD2L1 protein n=1 Tax=Branchiostoma lanceolatum TaxID=7740 RepID=A0A8J9ZBZ8_BRALA|nr:PKD2L1 [Branchiostoma lanceolatum]
MKIQLLILAFLAGAAFAMPLKGVKGPKKTLGEAQLAAGGRTNGLSRPTENPDVGPGPGFDDWMEGDVTLRDVKGSFNTDKVPYGPLRGPDEPANRNVRAVSGSEAVVGVWPLNARYGASDVTGNGNDGTAIGTQLAPGPYGDANGAFQFSGTADSYIHIPNNGKLDVRYSYTILAHIFPTGYDGPIFDYVGSNTWAVSFWQVAPQDLFMRPVGRDGFFSPYVMAGVLQQNAWNFVGGRYDSTTWNASIWNNGELVNETHIGVAEVASQYPIRVAVRAGDPRYYAGRIACLQLYNYAMTEAQIAAARDVCGVTPPPEDFQMTYITETSVTVAWKQRTNSLAIYYRIWIRRSDTADSLFTQLVPTGQTDLTFTDLTPGTEYVISATSFNRQNEGPAVNLTVGTMTPPPEDFQMTYITETSFTVAWKQRTNSLAIHHKIWIRRSDTADSLFTQLVATGQTDLTFTDLTPGTEYVISATSINRHNEGPAVILTVGTKTDSPMALEVELKTTNTITISWLPPEAVLTAYNITYTESGRSTTMMTPGDVDSCELKDLVPGTQYDISLVAVSRVGKSIAIGISVVTGTDPPSSLSVTKSSTTWMFLEWTPPVANILSYDLDISDEYGREGTLMRLDGHETSYNITGLVPETTYVIKMAAYSGNGLSVDITYSNSTGPSAGKSTKPPRIPQTSTAGLEQSLPEVVGPEDILAVMSNINEIIKPGDGFESEIPPSVLQTTAGIIEKLASAARGSQEMSIENMETIANVLLRAASAVIDVLPQQNTQTASITDNMPESDLIDTSAIDLSRKQQLKMLKEKEKEKGHMQRKTSQSIVASLDQVADTLLALQPVDVEYHSSFKTESVAVNVARFSSDEELILDSGDIVATIPPTPGSKTRDMLDVKMSVFKKNPYSWSKSTGGQNISSVTFLTINSKGSGNESKEQEVKLDMPFVPSQERGQSTGRPSQVTTERPSTTEDGTNGTTMEYHAFNVQYDNVIPVVRMNWWDVEATFHVYISYGSPPTEEKYHEKRVVKETGYEAWLHGTNFSTSFIPNTTNHGGRILYVGVQKLGSVSSAQAHQQQPTVQILSKDDYTLSVSAVGCSSWKDSEEQWKLEGCDADIDLDHGTISCRCHMTERKVSVGTMSLPLPNSINFINAFKNFRNLSENSVVFSIVVSEYILWMNSEFFLHPQMALRRRFTSRIRPISGASGGDNNQRKPLDKVTLLPPDRMPAPHVYQITVTTGSMFGAGTTSRIGFQLFGSEGTSPVKMLNPEGEALVRGSTLHFVMPVRESLGEVMTLHIWHDNSGEGDTSYFTFNDWLSSEKGDGEVQKVVHASTEEELTSFTNAFNEASRDVFYDKHVWASTLVAAPVGSSFTQAQRLSCCFTLLNTMMLASAMWYKTENTTADTRVLNLGFVRFTTEELYISLMTVLTVLPVNLMLLQIFRMEAPLSVNTPEMSIRPSKQGYFRKTLLRLSKYVAWVTVFLVSTISAFFVILYSMDWGKEKSDSWMKAFILSFMGSSCVMDTLQIFGLAVVLATIFSLPFLAKPPTIQNEDLQLNMWNSTAPKKVNPPAKSDGQSARKKKELSKKSASVLKDFLLLFIFAALLFYIAQADRDQQAFYETQSLSNNIVQKYAAIKTPDQFYAWTEAVLLPTLYPATWYNGRDMKYLDRQFAHNTGSFRFGPPRLTQVRQLAGSMASKSVGDLGWNFHLGNVSGTCWRFEVHEMLTHPNDIFDCTNRHSFDVPLGHDSAVSFFGVLKDDNFIDKYTKSVAIVLNFYNPSLKLFSVVNMIIDRSGVGHLVPTASITSFKLFQYESDADYKDLFIHILFTLVLLVIVYRELKAMKNTGWKYFTSKWNALVCISLIGTATTISVFIKRYVVASETIGMVAKSKGELGFERFVDLQTAAYWDACFKHILGLVVFINTISLLRVVRFSEPIGKLLALPGVMKGELMSFVVVAAVAFMAFISSGFLIFGSEMESYTDLYHTAFALFEMMLGRFFAQDMLDSNPLTGPIFFSTFMICIFILLMNFLMTIICDAISADVDVNHDRELADHMWKSFGAMLGFHSTPNKEEKPGVLEMEELKANICIIRAKLDEGLDICNSILPSNRQEKHPKNTKVPSFSKYGHCNTSCHIIREEHKLPTIVEENQNSTTGMEVIQQPADANVDNFDIATKIKNLEQEYEKEEKPRHENKEHKLLTEVRLQTKQIEDILSRVNRSTTKQTVQKVPRCIQVAAAPREKQNVTIATHNGQKRPTRNMWIPDLKLTVQDMAVLLSDDMLTDKHIHAAQMLLHRQYPGLGGLQDTAVGASAYGYTRVSGEGLQIHHAGILHWVVSSSIDGHVSVYNSLPSKINASLEHQLCQCYAPRSNIDTDVLTVKVPSVQVQSSRFTCGLFAIAWAVDIAMGRDVTQVRYKESRMRAHLLDCFERGHLSPFPQVRRITSRRPSAEHRIPLAAATLPI